MRQVFRVRKSLVASHAPHDARPGTVGADDDEEIDANHDYGTEEAATVHGPGDAHPPAHVWLGC